MNTALLVLPPLLQTNRALETPRPTPAPVDFFDADEIDRLAHAAWVREGARPGLEPDYRREVENQLWLSGLLAHRPEPPVAGHGDRHWESP